MTPCRASAIALAFGFVFVTALCEAGHGA